MVCSVCGQEYGIAHSCAGVAALVTPEESAPAPNLRLAPIHYFGEAIRILRWDDAAVRRTAKDNNSLLYGFFILAIAAVLPFASILVRSDRPGFPVPWNLLVSRYVLTLAFALLWIVLQIGLAHAIAKILFGAKGSFVGLMRPYLLGQIYQWFVIVPIVGGTIAGLGGIAVLMMVFEEVDGIERMKAFGLAVVIGAGFWITMILMGFKGTWTGAVDGPQRGKRRGIVRSWRRPVQPWGKHGPTCQRWSFAGFLPQCQWRPQCASRRLRA